MPKGTSSKVLANNKRASFDYAIEDTIEAGLVLTGTEIKSVRKGKISIGDAFVRFDGGEAILWNSNIAHFEQGNRYNHEQLRPRKLLLHKKQIANLMGLGLARRLHDRAAEGLHQERLREMSDRTRPREEEIRQTRRSEEEGCEARYRPCVTRQAKVLNP